MIRFHALHLQGWPTSRDRFGLRQYGIKVSYRGALAWALATPQNRDGLDPRRKSPPETDFSFGLLSPSEVMGC